MSPTAAEPAAAAERTLLGIANPLPLGFLGLAVASFAFACLQLGWIGVAQGKPVALSVLFFTVPVQLLASVAGFLRNQTPPATGMAVLAGTWAAISLTTLTSPAGSTSAGLGVLLLAAAASMLVPAVAGLAEPLASLVMAGAAVRFAVTAVYELTGRTTWQHTTGWVGLAVAALGWTVALAMALRDRPKS
jgi:uncharacterized protein